MNYQEFKLDGAAILDSDSPQQRIVVYHFNIPVDRAQDIATFERVRQQIEQDFPAESNRDVTVPLYFQISAVYNLVHRDTGEERLWQGSFNPRSRDLGQVTVFRQFDPQTFVNYALTRSSTERVLHELNSRTQGKDSVWSVSELLSVIITVQATVRIRHPVFLRHPDLLGPDHGGNGQGGGGNRGPRVRQRTVFRLALD